MDWLPILGGIAALITAFSAFIVGARRGKNDLVDQLQEERNRLDKKLDDGDARHAAEIAALSARVDTLSSTLNASLAQSAVKDLHIAILTNHIHMLNARIEKVDPPADPFPILPELPTNTPAPSK